MTLVGMTCHQILQGDLASCSVHRTVMVSSSVVSDTEERCSGVLDKDFQSSARDRNAG